MPCVNCGKENREDARFCDSCGTRLILICPSCNKELRQDARFCDSCGARLADATVEPPAPSPTPGPTPTPERTTNTEQPTVFANGRYQVKRFLGEGGKKKVYLAHDTMLDRDVVFALIKTFGLDDIGMTRVNREAQAMGRLGSHPHIVTVFDLGQEEGQPFMVTELMGGGDVEGMVEDSPENRVPMEQTMEIARAVCRGLEFAHSMVVAVLFTPSGSLPRHCFTTTSESGGTGKGTIIPRS